MRVILCIVSATGDLLKQCLLTALENASGKDIGLYLFANGGDLDGVADVVTQLRGRFSPWDCRMSINNIGLPAAFHEIWNMGFAADLFIGHPDDILCYIHDDVLLLEKGWDERVRRCFERHPNCGLAGFGGSTGLAGDEIYRVPYELHRCRNTR
jgi:hypothetical protein